MTKKLVEDAIRRSLIYYENFKCSGATFSEAGLEDFHRDNIAALALNLTMNLLYRNQVKNQQ